jgi:uncharacterized protein YkwD
MNWVDIFIIVFLLLFIFESFKRNFLVEFLDFFAFLFAFLFSLRFYSLVSGLYQSLFNIPFSFANVLGFITIWFLVESVLFSVIHGLAFKALDNIHAYKTTRILNYFSVIPAFLRGVILIALLLILVGTFPIQPRIKADVHSSIIGSKILAQTRQLEAPLKNVFGGISRDSLSFLTIKPKSDETVSLGFTTQNFKENPTLESQMIEMVNKERVSRGLNALVFDAQLRNVGREHSADMFKRGYFSHYSPEGDTVAQRSERYGIDYLVIGENLAYAPELDLAHQGLMDSPGHRANILSEDFGKIGIGIQDGGVYGLMVTQVFSN